MAAPGPQDLKEEGHAERVPCDTEAETAVTQSHAEGHAEDWGPQSEAGRGMEGSPQGVGSSVALTTLCSGTVRWFKATQLVALCDSRPRVLIRMGTFRWVDA